MAIGSDDEAAAVARLLQAGKIQGAGRDAALSDLRAYDTAKSQQPAATPAQPDSLLKQAAMAPVGGAENLTTGVTGTLARIPAGLAGLAAGAVNTGAGLVGAKQPLPDAADVVKGTQDYLTYKPHTGSGQAGAALLAKGAGAVGDKADALLGKAGQAVGGDTGENIARTVVPALADAVTSVGPLAEAGAVARGTGAIARRAESITEGAAKPSNDAPLATARAAGYKAAPSDVEMRNPQVSNGIVRPIIEGVAGNTRRPLQRANQPVSTAAGAKVISAADPRKLTVTDVNKAVEAPAAVYDATGEQLGKFKPTPEAKADLQQVAADKKAQGLPDTNPQKHLANVETGELNGPDVTKAIAELRRKKDYATADALEAEVERQLTEKKNPEGLEDFRAARKQFAQIYTVRDAMKGGQLDASAVGRVHQKNPNLLTGPLRTVGVAANELPGVTGLPTRESSGWGVGSLIGHVGLPGVVGAGIGHSVLPGLGGVMGGLAGATVGKLAQKGAQRLMESDWYQNRYGREMTPTEQTYAGDWGAKEAPPGAPIIGPARQIGYAGPGETPVPMGQDAFQGERGIGGHPGVARPAGIGTRLANQPLALPAPRGGVVQGTPIKVTPEGEARLSEPVRDFRKAGADESNPAIARRAEIGTLLAGKDRSLQPSVGRQVVNDLDPDSVDSALSKVGVPPRNPARIREDYIRQRAKRGKD